MPPLLVVSKFSFKINSSTAKTEELSCDNRLVFPSKAVLLKSECFFPSINLKQSFFFFLAMLKIAHESSVNLIDDIKKRVNKSLHSDQTPAGTNIG